MVAADSVPVWLGRTWKGVVVYISFHASLLSFCLHDGFSAGFPVDFSHIIFIILFSIALLYTVFLFFLRSRLMP